MRVAVASLVAAALCRTDGNPPPAVSVSGGIQIGSSLQPLVFTWNSAVPVTGSGWAPGETVAIGLQGPLNSLGVTPESIPLGSATADSQGAFSATPAIPYDGGATGSQVRIPRPGLYIVQAAGTSSGAASAANRINLAPATYLASGGAGAIDWSRERGTRVGVLPGALAAYSPERSDPNWISVWDNRPAGIYGTVAGAEAGGASQPARVSFEDDPITHYAHDTNFYLQPDPQYLWTVGTANYANSGEDDAGVSLGRIEVEWEALNNGATNTYGSGNIGLPDWAIATSGDRMYIVGRWVLDCGHPEVGDRTEMHPPRLVAVMRKRPAVTGAGAAATQVDIYAGGHGGAANRYPSGMDALLSQGGHGGGRIRDALSAADQQTYYQPGPLPFFEVPIINALVETLSGGSLTGPVFATAGPGAFSWGAPAPEQQPINDMDYDFDVPLPPPPGGATAVNVEGITHPQHTTAVAEAVTYTAGSGGLPAVAHIHLPYNGADNGTYARTLKFSWNTAQPPQHFRVTLQSLTVNSVPGKWQVWSDVSGQWTYLPAAAPALSNTAQGQSVPISGVQQDVYLTAGDSLRVLVQGYHAQCIDSLFGTLFGMSSYDAGIQLLTKCGPVNNDDLGGALLELPALPSSQGTYTVQADAPGQTGGGAFQMAVRVDSISPVLPSPECPGRGALAPAIAAGGVIGAGLSTPQVAQVSPDGLISIFGQDFAPPGTARGLTAADVQNGALPANLACTCVAVNQRLAPLLYVSPTLINVQAPTAAGESGAVVQVVANCGAAAEKKSAAQTASTRTVAPEFFFFKQNTGGVNPVAAIDAVNGALVGASGLLPGAAFTPAKPAEYVALFMTGLGPVDPPLPPGALAAQAAPTVWPVAVQVNGLDAPVLYAGAAPGFAGLCQVNVQVPATVPDGDAPLSLTIGGVSTPAGAFLTVRR